MEKKKIEMKEFHIEEIKGIDVEQEDRSVGIYGNEFCIVLKTTKTTETSSNKEEPIQLQIVMDDQLAHDLYDKLKKKLAEYGWHDLEGKE